MKRVALGCLLLVFAGCGKEREEKTQVARRTTRASTAAVKPLAVKTARAKATAVEPPPPYDEEERVVKPRPRISPALQKEVDAYLAEPPIPVTATDLVKAYQNEAVADERFKDRKVWVTGYVLRTGRGTLATPFVELDPGKTQGGAVRCFFEKGHTQSVEELKENQEVTIEGRVSAKTGNEVRLDDSRILTPVFIQSVTAAARDQKGNK